MFDPASSVFAGMPTATLQANLTAAQNALAQLMSGAKVVEAAYTQGDGMKQVKYAPTDVGTLSAYIKQLQLQLGIIPLSRRGLVPRFR